MDHRVVHFIQQALAKDTAVLLYSGDFNDEHTAQLIRLGEQFVRRAGGDKTFRNKLGFLMVESYQNIIRHRIALPKDLERGAGRNLFMVRQRGATFEVISMNAVPNEEVAHLTALLDRVRNLDEKQLKELFLDGLQKPSASRKGGAGLGLIEMSRRSKHDLVHHFIPIGAGHDLFTLRVFIGEGEMVESEIEGIARMHAIIAKENLLLVCKGRYTKAQRRAITTMIGKDGHEGMERIDALMETYGAGSALSEHLCLPDADPIVIIRRSVQGHVFLLSMEMDPSRAALLKDDLTAIETGTNDPLEVAATDEETNEVRSSGARKLMRTVKDRVMPTRLELTPQNDRVYAVLEVTV